MEDFTMVAFKLDNATISRLDAIKKQEGITKHFAMNTAISEFLDKKGY